MKKMICAFMFMLMLLPVTSDLRAGEGSSVLNGIFPFAGAYLVGVHEWEEPVVSFQEKASFTMLGLSLVDNIAPSWGFEATIAFMPDVHDSVYMLYFGNIFANLRFTNRFYPYLSVGAGWRMKTDPGDNETNLALNQGVGLKLLLTSSTHLRIDYRNHTNFLTDNVLRNQQNLVMGIGYSFDSVLFRW